MRTRLALLLAVCSLALPVAGCGGGHPHAAPPPAAEDPEAAGIERWEHHHAEASRELGEWVKNHPDAARKFFEWDAHHTARAHEFVTWTITHPEQPIETFVNGHPGWEYFDKIMENHRPAAETFMAWCRRHPKAAERLMNHPQGLDWAGHHLYASFWTMEHPHAKE
jgi:hypothetical protein